MNFIKQLKSFTRNRNHVAKQMQVQHEIMSRLTVRRDADPCDMQLIFDELTQSVCEGLSVYRVSIWLYNDDFSKLHCASAYSSTDGVHDIFDEIKVSDCTDYFKAIESGGVIQSKDVENNAKTKELVATGRMPKDTQALMHLPIWLEGEKMGCLCCEQVGKAYYWVATDQLFVGSVTHRVAMAMANCRRNKTEQLLKESEQRYELAVKGSSDGLWDWDLISNKMYRSSQFKKLLGYQADELCEEDSLLESHFHPEDKRRAKVALDAHLTDEDVPYEDELRLRLKTGEYRWFRCRGNALRDKNGKPYRVSGSITDVDDFKYVQRSLNRFKNTLGEVAENIFMFDPDTLKYFYVNKSTICDWGYTEPELLEMSPLDIKKDKDEEEFNLLLSQVISSEKSSLNYEAVYLRKDGEEVDVEVNLKYIAPENAPPRFVGIVRNISKRKQADIENYIQRTMLENISEVQDAFISSETRTPDFEKLLNVILDITESEFGLFGEVVYLENDSSFIRCRCVAGVSQDLEMQNNCLEHNDEYINFDTLLGTVIENGDSVIENDVESNMIATGFPSVCPVLESYMGIPLKLGDKLIGIIGIANRKEGYIEEIARQVQPLLSTCANLLDAERAEILRNSMEADLVEAKEEAERANLTKSEFLSSMSHELRTPLNAIMGFSQLLKLDSQLAEKQKRHATVIYSAGSLLLELINDVLDLSRIESDHIDLSIESVPLEGLLYECFRFIKPMAEKKGVDLIIENHAVGNKGSDDEVWVRADNTRLKQVLLNLLSNAIKYNKEAGSVRVSYKTGQNGMHRISIEDSGKGISAENMEKLFQPFNRLGAEQSETEGTGIGLVITRKLIELMGGAIQVESEFGRGTTFIIDIPVADVKEHQNAQLDNKDKLITAEPRAGYRILVAEDNLINQELITLQLRSLGYTSVVVNNGNDAFAELHEHNYDVLLTDIHMPGMGGHKLAQTIRESKYDRIRNIKIIAITANAANNEAEVCLSNGMNDYLAKPIDRDDLNEKLNRWLTLPDSKDVEKEVDEKSDGTLPVCKADAVIDMSQLVRYIGEDVSKHQHFFGLFLKTAPESIDALHLAYDEKVLGDIEFYSHKMKSSSHTLGLTGLSLLCQQLEVAAENEDWKSIDVSMAKLDATVSAVENSVHAYLNAFQDMAEPQYIVSQQ